MKHKLLISGGRDFTDHEFVEYFLDRFHHNPDLGIFILIHGAAKGVDTFGENWARKNNVMTFPFRPEYDKFVDKWKAPLARNLQMIKIGKPTCAMIFPGGDGTRHMFEACLGNKLHTYKIDSYTSAREFNKSDVSV